MAPIMLPPKAIKSANPITIRKPLETVPNTEVIQAPAGLDLLIKNKTPATNREPKMNSLLFSLNIVEHRYVLS